MVDEFPRTCTVTIQGGGVYGLTLLGQLAAVEAADFKPVAYAGASAGAIVATLAWAGYSTDEIRGEFERVAKKGQLLGLLGPFGKDDRGNEVNPSRLKSLVKNAGIFFNHVLPANGQNKVQVKAPPAPREEGWFKRMAFWPFRTIERGGGNIVRATTKAAGNMSLAAGGYTAWNRWGTGLAAQVQGAMSTVGAIWRWRGVFSGDAFEEFIDRMLLAKLCDDRPAGYKPTFGDFFEQFYADESVVPHPALFLTVSNVGRGDVDLIDSLSYAYKNIPISRAVRASMSFPLFFRPVSLNILRDAENGRPLLINNCDVDVKEKERLEAAICVDGGMVANFPLWLIAREVREVLYRAGRSDIDDNGVVQTDRPLEGVGFRPMFHIGLRLTPDLCEDGVIDPNPRLEAEGLDASDAYATALLDLAVSGVRNSLESALVNGIGRTMIVNQAYSQSAAPGGVLDFAKVTPRSINEMYRAGRDAGNRCFEKFSFTLPAGKPSDAPSTLMAPPAPMDLLLDRLREDIEPLMQMLRQRQGAPPDASPLVIRSNVFIRSQNKMIMRYASGMHGDADSGIEIEIEQGLVGIALRKRRMVLCDLFEARNNDFKFNFTEGQKSRLRHDRDWLLCVPIIDPLEPITTHHPADVQALVTADGYPFLAVADGPEGGIALGMLCVDANLGCASPDAKRMFDDNLEIRAMVALSEAAAIAAGRLLGQAFARKLTD